MFMEEAIKEAEKAFLTKDVPIGAVVVKDGEVIGRGHNDRFNNIDVTNHAEIIAIKEAAKCINDWRLNGCDLYVTLEPCDMCFEVIKESRIDNVYFLLNKEYKNRYKTNKCSLEFDPKIKEKYQKKLLDFFADNCNR